MNPDWWYPRVEALNNLLTLYGLERHPGMLAGGFIVFYPGSLNSVWLCASDPEESWLESVKTLTKENHGNHR